MAGDVTVEVKGLKELAEALQGLPGKVRGKALGAAVKTGADLVRDQARASVAVDTGIVQKSIVAYRKRGSTQDNISYEVGVTQKKRYKKGKKTYPPYYWRYLEFGTVKAAAKPFLRNAFTIRSGEALAMIKKMLAAAVEIAAAQAPQFRG